jgi:hypothetical protein
MLLQTKNFDHFEQGDASFLFSPNNIQSDVSFLFSSGKCMKWVVVAPIPRRFKKVTFSFNRCSDNCFPMRDFAEIWGNASDHDINNFFCWRRKKYAPEFSS